MQQTPISLINYLRPRPCKPAKVFWCAVALFLAFAGTGSTIAQTVYTTVPTAQVGTSASNRGPSGSVTFQRAASLYTEADMDNVPQGLPLTKAGFNISTAANAATTGTIKIYMVNSTDATFLRSTNWATLLSATPAMQLVYDGPLTIPNATGWYDVTLTTPFTYTGGSVYIAFEWVRSGAATTAPTYATNSTLLAGTNGWRGATGTSLPTDLTGTSAFRPWMRLGYTPPANDAAVLSVWSLGRLPLNDAVTPYTIRAAIANKGTTAITNRTFTLTVTGANPYTLSVLGSIPAGDTLIVNFPGYAPANVGSNTLTVTTPTDDVASNNSGTITMLTTANTQSYMQGSPAVPTGAVGINTATATGSGAFLNRYNVGNGIPVTIPSVRAVIANNAASVGKRVFGVVLNANGTIMARSAGYIIQSSDLGNSVTFQMITPPTVTDTDFFVGLVQTPDASGVSYPVGTQTDAYLPDNTHYAILSDTAFTTPTTPTEVNYLGRFMLEAVLLPVNDVGVSAVTGPASGCGLSSTTQICVTVQNFGAGSQSNIPVSYRINGGTIITETVAGPIASGASAPYCFTATADLSATGAYNIQVYSGHLSDAIALNDTTAVILNSVPIPSGAFTGLSANLCATAAPLTLTPAIAGGTFSGPGISGATFNPATAGPGTHTVTYSVTQSGCTGTSTQTVTVDAAPIVSFTGLAGSYCSDEAPATLIATPATGAFSGPGVTGTTFDPAAAGPGTHTVTYTYMSGGCTVTSTQTVIVTAPATVNFSGLAASYCATAPAVTLTGAPAGGTFSGPGITGNTFDPAAAGAGTHTITYTNTAGSCSGTSSQTVTVDAAPTVSFSGLAASYCVTSAAVTLTGTPAGGTFSGTGISGTSFDPATAGTGTYTITYTYTSGACSATSTQSVTVDAAPTASISGLFASYCEGHAPITLTGTPAGGTFSGPGVTGNSYDPVVSGTGTHTITYEVTQGACTATATQDVTITPLPVANAGADISVCAGAAPVTLTGFSPAGGTWSGNGVSAAGVFTPSTALVGTQQLVYTAVSNACVDRDTILVTVQAQPAATFTHTNNGGAYTFTTTAVAGATYSWNFGDTNTSATQNPVHTYATAGTYTVSLTVIAGACTTTTSQTVSVVLGLEDALAENLKMYPNPTSGNLVLEGLKLTSVAQVEVLNMLGQSLLLQQWQPNQEQLPLNLSGLPAGAYLIRISDNGSTVIKQVVLQK